MKLWHMLVIFLGEEILVAPRNDGLPSIDLNCEQGVHHVAGLLAKVAEGSGEALD